MAYRELAMAYRELAEKIETFHLPEPENDIEVPDDEVETFHLPEVSSDRKRAREFGAIMEEWARNEPIAIDAFCEIFPEWAKVILEKQLGVNNDNRA